MNPMILRFVVPIVIGVGILAHGSSGAWAQAAPIVHRHSGGEQDVLANAYLIETQGGVIAVDATMTVAESRKLRGELDALHKPLLAVLVTHGHPDHYGGVTGLVGADDVPVIATREVDRIIRRDDQAKGEALKNAGIPWAERRTFPNKQVESGESVVLGGLRFTAHDAGPGESHADAYWVMDGSPKVAFVGDLAVNRVHAFLADGHSGAWLEKLGAIKSALVKSGVSRIYPGHGEPGGVELFDWTRAYLTEYRRNVGELAGGKPALSAAQKEELSRRMAAFLPENRVPQFVTRSADPVAAELAGGAR